MRILSLIAVSCAFFGSHVFAETVEQSKVRGELAQMNEAMNRVEQRQAYEKAPLSATADLAMDGKYGPGAPASTKAGSLKIGGFLQVWYSATQNDTRGLFDDPAGTGVADTNEAFDNDTFRIRRAQLNFTIDVNQYIRAFINTDVAGEIAGFPQLPVGQKRLAAVSPEFLAANGPFPGSSSAGVAAVQSGAMAKGRYLRDAIINFHGCIPHHDISLGQMKTSFNHEDMKNEGTLDFAERAYITNQFQRDVGAVLHGAWWCDDPTKSGVYQGAGDPGRLQYWLGAYNNAGNFHQTRGQQLARPDDNDQKDFVGTLMLRPVWDDCWGKLELGYSIGFGVHGEAGSGLPASAPLNGLDRQQTWAMRHGGWAEYYFPRALKGLWAKGELAWVKDRNAPNSVIDQVNGDFQNAGDEARSFDTLGYWGAVGYKFSESPAFANCGNAWWKKFELLFRYEHAPNVFVTDPANIAQTNVYTSKVYTPGINYYIMDHNAKIQVNYNFVDNPSGPDSARFYNTRNDCLIVNFQVAF